jgi:hypothetical protein
MDLLWTRGIGKNALSHMAHPPTISDNWSVRLAEASDNMVWTSLASACLPAYSRHALC